MAKDTNAAIEMRANSFQDGGTCPICQESVEMGQFVMRCNACSSISHSTCWRHNSGCGSYHCSPNTHAKAGAVDLVITAHELENVQPPPKRISDPVRAAAHFLDKSPASVSKLGVIALLGSLLILLLSIVSVFQEGFFLMTSTLCGAVLCMLLGIISLVIINTTPRVKGLSFAGVGVLISGFLTVALVVGLGSRAHRVHGVDVLNFRAVQQIPTEEMLEKMEAPIANAMRANVVLIRNEGLGSASIGSGVILRIQGNTLWIVSNRHVTSDMQDSNPVIDVLLYSGERCRGRVVWQAPANVDLTILECQALSVPKLQPPQILADSVSAGEKVFAVGNPMEMYWSYTDGVISSLRTQQDGVTPINIYQTQTPINHGNSGGGLYRKDGVLIGINTWTQNKSVAEGLSFSLSSDSLLRLLTAEEVAKYLTVFTEELPPESLSVQEEIEE